MIRLQTHGRRLFIALAATTLLSAACGGDDLSNATSGGVDTESAAQSDADLDDFTAAMGDMDGVAEMAGVPEECLEISMAMVGAMGAVGGVMTDAQSLANVPAAFDALRSKAPEELRGDIDIVKAGFSKYVEVLKNYDFDFAKLAADPAALEEMSQAMDTEEFDEASDRFSTWLDSICGTG